jgi:hypothetical protein
VGYGEIFSRVMSKAIECEESYLKKLKVETPILRQSRDTVSEYREHWLWPGFLREAMADSDCPTLGWERDGRTDCCFLEGGRTMAKFELKACSPAPLQDAKWFRDIREDFGKQLKGVKQAPTIEHYVVLLPFGDLPAINTWIEQTLLPKIREDYLGIVLSELPAHAISLNRGGHVIVKVFRVTAAAA